MKGIPAVRRQLGKATGDRSLALVDAQPRKRPGSSARLYGYRWQQARKGYLAKHPCCKRCSDLGIIRAATVVDHITPHRGDAGLFWDRDNWQPLCKSCHDGWKQQIENAQRFER